MDPATKYAEMHPITDQQSALVCKKLKDWISRYGIPKCLHSGNRPCFASEVMQSFCTENMIEHTSVTHIALKEILE